MPKATFYHPQLLESDINVELSAEESAHATRSRRLRVGQGISLFNGKGLVATAELSSLNRGRVQANIQQCQHLARNQTKISVFTAIPKGDRQRFMVEALCQLGVDQITPLNCEHSVTRCSEKIIKKWQRYAIEACKQSQNGWLPHVQQGQKIGHCLEGENAIDGLVLFADPAGEWPASTDFITEQKNIFIGPEGGFSTTEIELFNAFGATPLRLSDNILRIETAAIASVIWLCR